jgi:hypothetical protein
MPAPRSPLVADLCWLSPAPLPQVTAVIPSAEVLQIFNLASVRGRSIILTRRLHQLRWLRSWTVKVKVISWRPRLVIGAPRISSPHGPG